MRILQVLPELKLAGAQIMVEGLTKELISKGHEVEVVSLYSYTTPLSERLIKDNVKIYFLGKSDGLDLRIFARLRKIIKDFNPDIIHTHTYALKYAYIASRLIYSGKIVHTIHNMADKETTEANRKLERKLFEKGAVQPVAISPIVKTSISSYYNMAMDDVPMIFNGITLNNCKPKTDYKLQNTEIRLIHIGRLQEQKNHEMMIDAMKILVKKNDRVCLHCFGVGPLKDEILEKIKSAGLSKNVILEGLTDNQYAELNKADIFLLPSKWEGMPITLIEAMGSALPIVATPVGGIPDIVQDGYSGILCNQTADDLAKAILIFVNDESMRRKYGQNALSRVNMFSSNQMASAYEEVYIKCSKNI